MSRAKSEKIIKTYDMTDKYGDQKVIEQSNGIVVKLNRKSSAWYQAILDNRAENIEPKEEKL